MTFQVALTDAACAISPAGTQPGRPATFGNETERLSDQQPDPIRTATVNKANLSRGGFDLLTVQVENVNPPNGTVL